MRSALAALLAASVATCARVCAQPVFNVLSYGARGDGVTDDTSAVRATFAAVASAGGGIVLFPAGGRFLTGAFNLTSHVQVRVEGHILGSQDPADYVLIQPLPWYGGGQDAQQSGQLEWQALVHAWHVEDVVITGGGVIDGQGDPWWLCRGDALPPCLGYSRPQLMMLVHSTNIQMYNITVQNSPSWTIHFANCTDVHVWNTTVLAPSNPPNTDGFDIDCSVNVLVEDSYYSGGDDAIAVKSGIDWLGRTFGRRTENVTIRNFEVGTSHGISVGSEMSAGVRNVTFLNITMVGTETGPHVKSVRGRGGVVEDIYYQNINVTNAGTAVLFSLNYHSGVPPTNATATPRFQNLHLQDVYVNGAKNGWQLDGLNDSTITNVSINNVFMTNVGDLFSIDDFTSGTCADATPACPTLLPPTA